MGMASGVQTLAVAVVPSGCLHVAAGISWRRCCWLVGTEEPAGAWADQRQSLTGQRGCKEGHTQTKVLPAVGTVVGTVAAGAGAVGAGAVGSGAVGAVAGGTAVRGTVVEAGGIAAAAAEGSVAVSVAAAAVAEGNAVASAAAAGNYRAATAAYQ